MPFAASAKLALQANTWLPDAVETTTQDVQLAPSVQVALKLPELALPLQTLFAQNARTVVQEVGQLLQQESRLTLPSPNSPDGHSYKMSSRNITPIKAMSSHKREKETGYLSDAN
jgi:hypothetical protein